MSKTNGNGNRELPKWIWNASILGMLTTLSVALMAGWLTPAGFFSAALLWITIWLLHALGLDSIIEVSLWKMNVKRQVRQTEEKAAEVARIEEELRLVARQMAESSVLMTSAVGADDVVAPRIMTLAGKRLDAIIAFAIPDETERAAWEANFMAELDAATDPPKAANISTTAQTQS